MRILALSVILLLCGLEATAQQTDSVYYRNDTAYIIKRPVVVTKKVYVQETVSKKKKKPLNLFFTPYIEPSYTLNRILVCNDKRDYYDSLNDATTSGINGAIGLMASVKQKRFQYSVDVSYTRFYEKFKWSENVSDNIQQTLSAALEIGYYLIDKQNNPFRLLISLGGGYQYSIRYSGLVINENNSNESISQKSVNYYRQSSLICNSRILGTYQMTNKAEFFFGPSYSTNLQSITQSHVSFKKWRNNIGFFIGMGYKL